MMSNQMWLNSTGCRVFKRLRSSSGFALHLHLQSLMLKKLVKSFFSEHWYIGRQYIALFPYLPVLFFEQCVSGEILRPIDIHPFLFHSTCQKKRERKLLLLFKHCSRLINNNVWLYSSVFFLNMVFVVSWFLQPDLTIPLGNCWCMVYMPLHLCCCRYIPLSLLSFHFLSHIFVFLVAIYSSGSLL